MNKVEKISPIIMGILGIVIIVDVFLEQFFGIGTKQNSLTLIYCISLVLLTTQFKSILKNDLRPEMEPQVNGITYLDQNKQIAQNIYEAHLSSSSISHNSNVFTFFVNTASVFPIPPKISTARNFSRGTSLDFKKSTT